MLKIFNTLTKQKEKFRPTEPKTARIYVCGVTPHAACHIGHGRVFVVFDMIVRYLRHCGYSTNYVTNITDIDDKIILRARENHETHSSFVRRMIHAMHRDLTPLGLRKPNRFARVTEHISDIVDMIQRLLSKKHAYLNSAGDVMFSIQSYPRYGRLSRRRRCNEHSAEERGKRSDFVLWKTAKDDEPYWSSPWGNGRPGWHIECSAISCKYLGSDFDLHGGGLDLVFPHHENEMAQSVCVHGSCAKTWMHVGTVMFDRRKVSQSFDQTLSMRHLLAKHDPETVKYFILSHHYRKRIDFDEENIERARSGLEHLYLALRGIEPNKHSEGHRKFANRFGSAMDDDFDSPHGCSVLFQIASKLNRCKETDSKKAEQLAFALRRLGKVLGILQQDPHSFLQQRNVSSSSEIRKIEDLVRKRNRARKLQNWHAADRIRRDLCIRHVVVEDGVHGTFWRKSKERTTCTRRRLRPKRKRTESAPKSRDPD